MPRNEVSKDEFVVRVLKLKNRLYNGSYSAHSQEWHDGAHHAIHEMLNILQEYRS